MLRVAGLCGSLYTQNVQIPNMSYETLSYRDNSLCTGRESVTLFYREGNVNHMYIDGSMPGHVAARDGTVDWYIREEVSDVTLFGRYVACKKNKECMMQGMLPLITPAKTVPPNVQSYFTK